MAAYVTVPGGTYGTISIGGSSSNKFVAQVIANSILLASKSGGVQFAEAVASTKGSVYVPPANLSDAVRELIIPTSVTGVVNIPTGYTDVVIAGTGPVSLVGSSNVEIASNATSGSYSISGSANEALSGGNNNLNVGGTGATYIIAIGGTGTNDVKLTGRGVFTGSDGKNIVTVKDTSDSGSKVFSVGTNDVVSLGGDKVSVIASGPGTSIQASGLRGYAQLLGSKESVFAGSGADSIYSGGTQDVVLGNSGTLGVYDSGTNDTIAAFGAASPSIAAWGKGADIFGGSNPIAVTLSGAPVNSGGTLVAVQGGNTFFAGSGNAKVDLGPVVVSNAGTLVTIQSATNVVIGGSGSLYVSDSGAFDTVAAFGAASAVFQESGQDNILFTGSNQATVGVGASGFGDTIALSSGPAVVSAAGSKNVILGNSGSFTLFDASSGDTIGAFGASSATVTLVGSNSLLFGGLNAMSVTLGGTNNTIVGGAGPVTISAQTSGLVFAGKGPLDFLGGSAAPSTVVGAPGSDVTFAATSGGAMFLAGAGNETLNASGSTTNAFFAGGSGNELALGGSGNDTFTAGAGSDTMAGGAGNNAFVFFASQTTGAQDYITDWSSRDSLFLIGYGPNQSAASLLANATSAGGNVTVKLADNTTITFDNLASTSALVGKVFNG